MTGLPRVSVIIVSRYRPGDLQRCVAGVAQQDHPGIELVVVADSEGLAVAQASAPGPIKTALYDKSNISAARNIGLALAAGEVVAFIDDDAVPEPTWASRLATVFADHAVAAAGGFVRGRNGISLQWRAQSVNRQGQACPLETDPVLASLHQGQPGHAIKTEGTNMAFRRALLAEVGGFDPALRFYLDETELDLRLAARAAVTAIVPLAQVHHGYAASDRRRSDRVPLSLAEIGASTSVVLARHAPPETHASAVAALRVEQRARLLRLLVAGRIEPRDVRRLMRTLDQGIAEGRKRPLSPLAPLRTGPPAFLPLPGTGRRAGLCLYGWSWQRTALRRAAIAAGPHAHVITIMCFSPTALFHRIRFHSDGFWEQTGGIFGRSDRDQPLFQAARLRFRVQRECARLASLRPVGEVGC